MKKTLANIFTQIVVTFAIAIVNASAGNIIYSYDPLNRLTNVDYGNGSVIRYTYDAAGNRLTYSGMVANDTTAPIIAISNPTSCSTFATTNSTITLSGTASDNVAVSLVTWANDRSGIGTATGTNSWSINGIHLQNGTNVITVTAYDAAGNSTIATLSVIFSSVVVPTRIIGLSGNLSFGNVAVGSSAQATLTISNTGNSAMTVSSISYPNGFSGAWSGTIAAGNSQPVIVTFAPIVATSYGGTVTVNADQTSGANTIVASGTYVDNQFNYTTNNGSITITGYTGPGGAVIIPSTVYSLPVTSIGDAAFSGCTNLTSVTIPNSVTSIGSMAFYSCTSLASLMIPNSVTNIGAIAFSGCTSLASVTIPNSVTSIEGAAFSGCTSLASVTIPNSVTSIEGAAFSGCTSLASITIPNSVTSIGDMAFSWCRSLTNVTIPNSTTNIGEWAFSYCYNLRAITVNALNMIYSSVDGVLFDKNQTVLIQYPGGKVGSDFTTPNSLTCIRAGAFSGCTSLTSVNILNSVTNIGNSAFSGCYNLNAITVDAFNSFYSSEGGVLFDKNQTVLIQYPTGKIGNNFTIPNSVTTIEGWSFSSCISLTSVTIPNSVTNIGESAFSSCISLNSINIPASVTSIGDSAFSDCSSLTGVYFQGNAPSLGLYVFYYADKLTVYYLPGTTGWDSTFGGRPTMLWNPISTSAPDFLWSQEVGGNPDGYGSGVAVDAAGNAYVTGSFQGTGTFGTTSLVSSNSSLDIYLAKYDPSGKLVWAQQIGGTKDDRGFGVALDAQGNIYVTGDFAGTVSFGGIILSSPGQGDMFIAKFDNNGNTLWAKQAGGSGSTVVGEAIAVDVAGNSYLTGYFAPQNGSHATVSVIFGNVTLTSTGVSYVGNTFVAKYDTGGNVLWVRQTGGPDGGNQGAGIAVDGSGNVYVTGSFYLSTTFENVTLSAGDYAFFVAKYDTSGHLAWAKRGGAGNYDRGFGIVADGGGNSFVTGWIGASGPSHGDLFVGKYDSAGNEVWLKQYGGAGTDEGDSIALDSSGNLYVAGSLNKYNSVAANPIDFGGINLTTAGNGDVVIAKLDSGGNVLWAKTTGGPANDYGHGIALDKNGNAYVRASTGLPAWGASTIGSGSQDTLIKLGPAVQAITITQQPASQRALVGTNVTFSVVASNSASVFYQWKFNGNPLSGQTNATLTLNNVQTNQAGQYAVTLSNLGGSVNSGIAVLTILSPLTVTIQPWSSLTLVTNVGAMVDFAATAAGTGSLSYQWSKGGLDLIGATNSHLILTNVSASDSDNYVVQVTSQIGYGTAYVTLLVGATLTTPSEYTFVTLAGPAETGAGAVDGTGSAARFSNPYGVAVDSTGNVYVAEYGNNTIRKIGPGGEVTTVAGLAGSYGSADGTGSAARFNRPSGVAVDNAGNVYVADQYNYTIRKVGPGGVVTTVAGLVGISGNADGTGSAARFNAPSGVAVDSGGNVYVADSGNHTIRKIGPGGVVTTVAGLAGNSGSADGTGSAVRFYYPNSVAVDSTGNVYVAEYGNNTIRKIGPGGVVTTMAGLAGSSGSADGTGSAARFYFPFSVAVDNAGSVHVADSYNNTIRKVGPGGVVTTVAGLAGCSGATDGTGSAARFYQPSGVAMDSVGNVYVGDTQNHTIRKIGPGGMVTTLAGLAASFGSDDGTGSAARFNAPSGVAVDSVGNVYVADYGNFTIRKIGAGGMVATVAGLAGSMGSADGTGSAARFYQPNGVAVDSVGNVYVADSWNATIRKIGAGGVVTTLAGLAGIGGSTDGTGSAARFYQPYGVAVDSVGNLYVADYGNFTIRKIGAGGVVTTLAGLAGIGGSTDGTGSAARFYQPYGVAVDSVGNVYVADYGNFTIRKIGAGGMVTTVAGLAGSMGNADGMGSAARFNWPSGLAVDSAGNVYVADSDNNEIRKIGPGGMVTTVAGLAGSFGSADGTGSAARFYQPYGVAMDSAGNLYVADTGNNCVRVSVKTCPDLPVIDLAAGPMGISRQLDTAPQTATNWQWSIIRRPDGSRAQLSAINVRNPVFTPDVADLYVFQLRATNALGAICIRNVEFRGLLPPIILTGPASQTVLSGTSVTFSVVASNSASVSYQWKFNDNPLSGQTNATLTLNNVQTNQAGQYVVTISNMGGSVASEIAVLAVLAPLTVTIQPWSPLTLVTNVGATVDFAATAAGAGPLSYQWSKGVLDLIGATNSHLILTNVSAPDSANYAVQITSQTGYGTAYVTLLVGATFSAPSEYTFVTLAGPAETGAGAVDGTGSVARFRNPSSVAVDSAGNVYVADTQNRTIRKIGPGGMVTTVAGLAGSYGSVDGTGSAARFYQPTGVAVDSAGNVYVADGGNHTIRKVGPGGVVTTVGGDGIRGSADGKGSTARFYTPSGVAVDDAGNVYVADSGNHTIRKVGPGGMVATLAGLAGSSGSADGTGNTARFNNPYGVAVDNLGNVYVADSGNHTIRKIGPGGEVTTVAGLAGSSGSADGTGNAARFYYPKSVVVDSASNLYVADSGNHTIRKIGPGGVVTTPAGFAGNSGSVDGTGSTARFNGPSGVAVDNTGNVYVADNVNNTIRKIGPGSVVTTVAGLAGNLGSTDGTGNAARFSNPYGVAVDSAGNVYVADNGNNTIRKIGPGGVVTTLAGLAGSRGSADGTGSAARFAYPAGVAVDSAGNVYVADRDNHTIRKIGPAGEVITVAGKAWSSGSADGTGSAALFNYPSGVAVDSAGNVYVADLTIRKIGSGGVVTTVAGNAGFYYPSGVAVDSADNVYVADDGINAIRRIGPGGEVTNVAGDGIRGSADGKGSAAQFNGPLGVAVDSAGNVYVADSGNNAIRLSKPACADVPIVDLAAGPVGATRQLDTAPQTATNWEWRLIRQPDGSHAQLSATNIRNPVFTPDVSDLYVFQLRATNAQGAVCIRNLQLGAGDPPAINKTPASQKVNPGVKVTFGVVASNTASVSYQWLYNGNPLSGQTNATLTLYNVQTNQSGHYEVTLSNLGGSVTSEIAVLAVLSPLTVSIQPGSPLTLVTNVGATVDFAATAAGTGSLSYQWSKGGLDLLGATNSHLTLTNVSASDSDNYVVQITSQTGYGTAYVTLLVGAALTAPSEYTFITLAGPVEAGSGAVDGTGGTARFSAFSGVAVDSAGNVYVADSYNHTIRKIGPGGVVTTVAGLAGSLGSADGTGSTARFRYPSGVVVDRSGNVYVADLGNNTIRKIGLGGVATTLAGLAGSSGSADGTGSVARFYYPDGMAVDSAGNVYVADSGNHAIRKIGPDGVVTTLAGKAGSSGSADGTGNAARFYQPSGVAVDNSGNVYVADQSNSTIRKIEPDGVVTTVAGLAGSSGSADGTGSTARFYYPNGMVVDSAGNVYVADSYNNTIRKIGPGGVVTTVAGLAGSSGSADGTGSAARFYYPNGMALDGAGNMYVADTWNSMIRKIGPGGVVTTVAGLAGSSGSADGTGSAAQFYYPRGVAMDSADNVYVADQNNQTIRKIGPGGVVATVVGKAISSGSADGTGSAARFDYPSGVALDSADNVYVADQYNHTIRKIGPGGVVTTLAGLAGSYESTDGTGSAARFYRPSGVAVDSAGNVYVADTYNNTIRKIGPGGVVTSLAGGGWFGSSDDGTGSAAGFYNPYGVALDSAGNVYVADSGNNTIRKIGPGGVVTTVAGLANRGMWGSGIDGTGRAARFSGPSGVAVDNAGNVYVADYGNSTIRKIGPDGVVTTVAGKAGSSGGTDGTGSAARFNSPSGVAVDGAGNVYVADTGNNSIRVSIKTCPDLPVIDLAAGPVGISRQLDTAPQTATNWQWNIIRRPSGSVANLSSTSIRNPTFVPDVADLYVFQLRATNALGAICIRNLELTGVVPLTNVPVLNIARSGQKLNLFWGASDGFILESTDKLQSGAVWTVVPGVVSNAVDVTKGNDSQFFRLRK